MRSVATVAYNPVILSRSDGFGHLNRHFISSEWCAQLHSRDHRTDLPHHLLRNRYALGARHLLETQKKEGSWQNPERALLATSFAGGTTYAGWQWNDYLFYWKLMGKQLVLSCRRDQGH